MPRLALLTALASLMLGATARASTCDPSLTQPLATGLDANHDGADDYWTVTRPDSTTVAAPILSTPQPGWRGGSALADETGAISTARYPLLGEGTWIGYAGNKVETGTYTFTRTFDLSGYQTVWLVGEWAVDDRISVSINGFDLPLSSNSGASPPLPFIDNYDGPDATCADPELGHVFPSCEGDGTDPCQPYMCEDTAAEGRELHLAIASVNFAPWLFNMHGTNTLSISVQNLSGPVGLLITGGDGTSIPGGAYISECRPELDFGAIDVPDMDSDGVVDTLDTCPTSPNTDQTDSDGDGFGDPCDRCVFDPVNDEDGDGFCASAGDCDDTNDTVYEGAEENEDDGIDNNCNGQVDESVTSLEDGNCNDQTDNDGDGLEDCEDPDCCDELFCYEVDAALSVDFQVCEHVCDDETDNEPPSGDGFSDCEDPDCCIDLTSPCMIDNDGDSFTECNGDCDDDNVDVHSHIINDCGATLADGLDNDCDGMVDEDRCNPDPGGPGGCCSVTGPSDARSPLKLAPVVAAGLALLVRRRKRA